MFRHLLLSLALAFTCSLTSLAQLTNKVIEPSQQEMRNDIERSCPMVVPQFQSKQSFGSMTRPGCRLLYDPTDTTVYRVPVVVHIIHNGEPIGTGANVDDARVFEQIRILNEDFRRRAGTPGFNTNPVGADARIEFVLAAKDTLGQPFNGIVRKNGGQSTWSVSDDRFKRLSYFRSDQYFNIWVINLSVFLGYGSWPVSSLPGMGGLGSLADSAKDGLVIGFRYFGQTGTLGGRYNQGRTATHEIGHCLGLIHVWGDGDCSATDHCDDTPAQNGQHFFCPNPAPNTCTNLRPGPDQIENFMQYTDDVCMNVFTQDQVRRMRTVMQLSPLRCTLPSSPALPTSLPGRLNLLKGSLYPNPTYGGELSLSVNTIAEIRSITLHSSTGQKLVLQWQVEESGSVGLQRFRLASPEAAGIYFLKVETNDGQLGQFRLVVQ